jgi:hypothetical protein
MYRPKAPITTAAEVKAILGPVHPSQIAKVIDHVDEHCAKWIERCPFIVISSINAAGSMDVSPKGDSAGFVRVLNIHWRYPTGSATSVQIRFSTSSTILVSASSSSCQSGARSCA